MKNHTWATRRREGALNMRFLHFLAKCTIIGWLVSSGQLFGVTTLRQYIKEAKDEQAVITALDAAATEKYFDSLEGPHSVIGKMIAASRLCQLNPQRGRLAVLDSLPKSGVEMEALRRFTYETNGLSSEAYRSYYRCAFIAVDEHPQYVQRLMLIAMQYRSQNNSAADDSDWFCGQLRSLYLANPILYDRTVANTIPDYRSGLRYCGHNGFLWEKTSPR
jgi:hypothetical protein